jgi:hypothetical protein
MLLPMSSKDEGGKHTILYTYVQTTLYQQVYGLECLLGLLLLPLLLLLLHAASAPAAACHPPAKNTPKKK